jgi:hypothetical protein
MPSALKTWVLFSEVPLCRAFAADDVVIHAPLHGDRHSRYAGSGQMSLALAWPAFRNSPVEACSSKVRVEQYGLVVARVVAQPDRFF